MKKEISTTKLNKPPKYYEKAKIICACGNTFEVGSTRPEIHVEICSACHPLYTGKHKFVDTARRVDKFQERLKKSQQIKEQRTQQKKKE